MNTINVKIDVTTTKGCRLARELYGQKGVEIENPIQPEVTGKTYSVKETFDELKTSLKEYYEVEE